MKCPYANLTDLCRVQDRRCACCFEHMAKKRRLGSGPKGKKKRDNPNRASIDHVVPRALGGLNEGNIVAVHLRCNGRKGGRMPTGCELVVLAWVNARLRG